MTPLVWANFPLALVFILAIAGIPLWMTFKRPQTSPDHSQARAYLAAKAAVAQGQAGSTAAATLPAEDLSPAQGRVLTRPSGRHSQVPPRRKRDAATWARQHSA